MQVDPPALAASAAAILTCVGVAGAAAMAISSAWSRRVGAAVTTIAVLGAAAAQFAGASPTSRWLTAGSAIAVATLWLHDRGIPGNRRRPLPVRILAAGAVTCAAAAAWATVT